MTNYEIMTLKDGIINSKNKIKTLTEYLNEHPDDLGVQLSLSNHKTRLKELELELSIIKKIMIVQFLMKKLTSIFQVKVSKIMQFIHIY